jgi:hypothetical protein
MSCQDTLSILFKEVITAVPYLLLMKTMGVFVIIYKMPELAIVAIFMPMFS